MPLRFVVDDRSPDKTNAGGAVEFAKKLVGSPELADAHSDCSSCKLLADVPGAVCFGVIDPPVSSTAEEWLVARLPESLESLPGLFLRKTLHDMRYQGQGGRALRKGGLLQASGPYIKHYGPFFRRYTVSSEQLLEQLFCVGDFAPVHSLGLLVELGALDCDGKIQLDVASADLYGDLVKQPESRRERTRCNLVLRDEDDRSVIEVKTLLIAAWAAFVQDVDLRLVEDE